MLFIELLLFSFSLSNLNNDIKNILFEGRYFISEVLTFASEQQAEIICKEQTTISRIYHLDRGYEKIENKLRKIGVNIKRLS